MPQDRSNADVDPTSRSFIFRLNSQGIIQWTSDSIANLLDHDGTTMVGEKFFELFPAESFEQAQTDNDSRSLIRTFVRFDQKKIYLKTRHFEHTTSGTQTVIAVEFSAEMEKANSFLTKSQQIHQKLNQLEEEKELLKKFEKFVESKNCSVIVKISYQRAKLRSSVRESTTQPDIDCETFEECTDKTTTDLTELVSTFIVSNDQNENSSDHSFDFEINVNWSHQECKLNVTSEKAAV